MDPVPQTQEGHSLMREIVTLLHNQEDEQEGIEKIGDTHEQLKLLRQAQQQQIKQDIQGLLALKTEEEQQIQQKLREVESSQESQLAELAANVDQAAEHRQAVNQQLQAVKQQSEQSQAEQQALQQEKERIQRNTTQDLPKLRYDVNLYNNITRIRWQYDCEASDIKGYACNKNDVKPFSLNSKQNSQFFIANYLWDIMEPDW